MVNSNGRDPREAAVWRRAMREQHTISEETIESVVVATETKPENLVALQEASDRSRIPLGTLHYWIHVGHLKPKERTKSPGGKLLVDWNDVAYLMEHRPKIGRPPKNGQPR